MLSVSTIIAKWLERSLNKTQYHKRSNTERTQWFIPWFGQVQHLPTSTLWRPNGRGLQSTPLKRSKDPHEYHGVLFAFQYPVCEESPQLGVSRPYNKNQSESTRVREGSNTHKSTAKRTHTAKTRVQMNITRFSLERSSNH